jgi:hypothetical protein
MEYFELVMISLILAGCGGLLGYLFADLKYQIDLLEASREDAKVYYYDEEEEE